MKWKFADVDLEKSGWISALKIQTFLRKMNYILMKSEIIDIYTKNELRRLREKPWYDESNKYYYMKTPDGQNFKGSPHLLGQLWREHIRTKAIRRTKAEKDTPIPPPNAPKKNMEYYLSQIT